MAEQIIKTRIINKHDIPSNWIKAVNFVPKQGEIIIYDKENNPDMYSGYSNPFLAPEGYQSIYIGFKFTATDNTLVFKDKEGKVLLSYENIDNYLDLNKFYYISIAEPKDFGIYDGSGPNANKVVFSSTMKDFPVVEYQKIEDQIRTIQTIQKESDLQIYYQTIFNETKIKIGDGTTLVNNLPFIESKTSSIIEENNLHTEGYKTNTSVKVYLPLSENVTNKTITLSDVSEINVGARFSVYYTIDLSTGEFTDIGGSVTAVDKTTNTITLTAAPNFATHNITLPITTAQSVVGCLLIDNGNVGEVEPKSDDFISSHAEGSYTKATLASHAEGYMTESLHFAAHAEGKESKALGYVSHAEGTSTVASGTHSHAEGSLTTASGFADHAEGANTIASGGNSHAEGNKSVASGSNSHAEGTLTTASGIYSHTEGRETIASNETSHAEGYQTESSGRWSHAEGNKSKAIVESSHAEGSNTEAKGVASHSEGEYSSASGYASHAEGNNTKADGDYSHVEGRYSQATYHYAHAEGSQTIASNVATHAEGNGTKASGQYSHAEGSNTESSSTASHAEGANTVASGGMSHAEGNKSKATSEGAHAEGILTTASGYASHAEGRETVAAATYSHASGLGTKTNVEASTVVGKYNNPMAGDLFQVGIGSNDSNRDNGLVVTDNGEVKPKTLVTDFIKLNNQLTIPLSDMNTGKSFLMHKNEIVYSVDNSCVTSIGSGAGFNRLVVSKTKFFNDVSNITNIINSLIGKTVIFKYNGIEYHSSVITIVARSDSNYYNLDITKEEIDFGKTTIDKNLIDLITFTNEEYKWEEDMIGDLGTKAITKEITATRIVEDLPENMGLKSISFTEEDEGTSKDSNFGYKIYCVDGSIVEDLCPTSVTNYKVNVSVDKEVNKIEISFYDRSNPYIVGYEYLVPQTVKGYVDSNIQDFPTVMIDDIDNLKEAGFYKIKTKDSRYDGGYLIVNSGLYTMQYYFDSIPSTRQLTEWIAQDMNATMPLKFRMYKDEAWTSWEYTLTTNYGEEMLTQSKTYADTKDSEKLKEAKAYTDAKTADTVRKISSRELRVMENSANSDIITVGTGWTGNFESGYTHASGNVEPITININAVVGESWLIEFDYSGYKEKNVCVSLGDSYPIDCYNGLSHAVVGVVAANNGSVTIIPNTSYTGTVTNISCRKISEEGTENVVFTTDSVGYTDVPSELTAFWNIKLGANALGKDINGSRNIAIGNSSLRYFQSGARNIGIGTFSFGALKNGEDNIAIGADSAFLLENGVENIAIGRTSMGSMTSAERNVALGEYALYSNNSSTPKNNVAIGHSAGYKNAYTGNTFVGYRAGYYNENGANNVFIGANSGNLNKSGNNNIFIGPNTKSTAGSGNVIVIGNTVEATGSNQVVIGLESQTLYLCGKKINFNSDGTVTWEAV